MPTEAELVGYPVDYQTGFLAKVSGQTYVFGNHYPYSFPNSQWVSPKRLVRPVSTDVHSYVSPSLNKRFYRIYFLTNTLLSDLSARNY